MNHDVQKLAVSLAKMLKLVLGLLRYQDWRRYQMSQLKDYLTNVVHSKLCNRMHVRSSNLADSVQAQIGQSRLLHSNQACAKEFLICPHVLLMILTNMTNH